MRVQYLAVFVVYQGLTGLYGIAQIVPDAAKSNVGFGGILIFVGSLADLEKNLDVFPGATTDDLALHSGFISRQGLVFVIGIHVVDIHVGRLVVSRAGPFGHIARHVVEPVIVGKKDATRAV